MERRILWRALGVLLLARLVSSSCFPALFNFGDSTSDTGGIHASFPTSTPAEYYPYGENLPGGKSQFRYSDGLLLIDYIARGLGLNYIDPFLQSVTSDFTQGANFATAGATARPVTYLSPFNLGVQVKQFVEFKSSVTAALAANPGNTRLPSLSAFSQGLYTISIGGNDFTYGYTRGQSTAQVQQYLPLVVTAITQAVQTLYNYGARHIIVFDAEPQGCLPYILTLISHTAADLDEYGCYIAYNQAAQYYNRILKNSLQVLGYSLPGADLIFLSTYDIKFALNSNKTANGFQYTTVACCGVPSEFNYNTRVNCGSSGLVNGVQLTAVTCANPSLYTVWDGVHNTQAANKYIAKQIFSGAWFSPSFPRLTQDCGLSPF